MNECEGYRMMTFFERSIANKIQVLTISTWLVFKKKSQCKYKLTSDLQVIGLLQLHVVEQHKFRKNKYTKIWVKTGCTAERVVTTVNSYDF